MTKRFSILKITLFALIMTSCASSAKDSYPLPRLEDRTLHISADGPYLIYPHRRVVCKHPERRVFRGCKTIHLVEKYDLTDAKVRKLLIGKGFHARSRYRFKYD